MKTKRRFLSILLALCMVLSFVPTVAFAEGTEDIFTVDGIQYKVVDSTPNTVEVIHSSFDWESGQMPPSSITSTYSGTISIPSTVQSSNVEYRVVGIGVRAFLESSVSSITLPDTVQYVKWSAFEDCDSLQSITIPASVGTIGESTFKNCGALTTIVFADNSGLTTIGNNAFEGCTVLSTLQLPDSVTSIGTGAFGKCAALKSLKIPAGVTEGVADALTGGKGTIVVGGGAYPNLNSITFAAGSPYTIESGILYNGTTLETPLDTTLTEINIKQGTETIYAGAFNGMGITKVVMPDTVKVIEEAAFANCPINDITWSPNVQAIGDSAFAGSTVPTADLSSVKTIGREAFSECLQLGDVNLSSVETIDDSAFWCCSSLNVTAWSQELTNIGDEAFLGCGALESIVLPEGLLSIGDSAFDLTTEQDSNGNWINPEPKLQSINIPSSVTYLGTNFLGGIKPNGETLLISNVADPSIFNEDTLAGISGEGMNAPTLYVPDSLKDAYENFEGDLPPIGDVTAPPAGVKITVNETAAVCPGQTTVLAVQSTLPEGAELTFTSSDPSVATVAENGDVTGVKLGEATITASITLNGVILASDECTVTVAHRYGEDWDSDEINHWHNCDCGAKDGEETHTFGDWKITKEATASETGTRERSCTICGRKVAETIPATGTTKPTDPSEPSTPSEPDDTSKPSEPNKPDDNKDNPDMGANIPQTGDSSNLALWFVLLFAAAGGLTATTIVIRKRKSE